MKNLIFKIKIRLDRHEFDVLTKALNFYILGAVTFDYPDEIEICKDIQRKIKRHLSTEYLENNTIINI